MIDALIRYSLYPRMVPEQRGQGAVAAGQPPPVRAALRLLSRLVLPLGHDEPGGDCFDGVRVSPQVTGPTQPDPIARAVLVLVLHAPRAAMMPVRAGHETAGTAAHVSELHDSSGRGWDGAQRDPFLERPVRACEALDAHECRDGPERLPASRGGLLAWLRSRSGQ